MVVPLGRRLPWNHSPDPIYGDVTRDTRALQALGDRLDQPHRRRAGRDPDRRHELTAAAGCGGREMARRRRRYVVRVATREPTGATRDCVPLRRRELQEAAVLRVDAVACGSALRRETDHAGVAAGEPDDAGVRLLVRTIVT